MNTTLVIGAAGGIGVATVKVLVEQGDAVIGTVLDKAQADRLRREVPGISRIEILALDDADAAVTAVSELASSIDGLNQVAACVAIGPAGPVETSPIAIFRQAMEINVLSSIAIYQGTVSALRKTRGRLVFVSSLVGKVATPILGAYAASKHALEGVADAMRMESATYGVAIILIEPGGVVTPFVTDQLSLGRKVLESLTPDQETFYGPLCRGFVRLAEAGNLGGEGTRPEQVADVILKALSDIVPTARYVVGSDAEQMLQAKAAMTTAEFDKMILSSFWVE